MKLPFTPAFALAPAALVAALLAGCTVIPPADPARTGQMPHRPGPAPLPDYTMAPRPAPPAGGAPPYVPPPAYSPPYSPPPASTPAPAPALAEPAPTYAALGQTVRVDGPRITPVQVLEDSRCPMNARCVWGGQVRLRVRIDSGPGGEIELTSGKPATVADGTLELVQVQPDKVAGGERHGAIAPSAYRFGFRFSGGY